MKRLFALLSGILIVSSLLFEPAISRAVAGDRGGSSRGGGSSRSGGGSWSKSSSGSSSSSGSYRSSGGSSSSSGMSSKGSYSSSGSGSSGSARSFSRQSGNSNNTNSSGSFSVRSGSSGDSGGRAYYRSDSEFKNNTAKSPSLGGSSSGTGSGNSSGGSSAGSSVWAYKDKDKGKEESSGSRRGGGESGNKSGGSQSGDSGSGSAGQAFKKKVEGDKKFEDSTIRNLNRNRDKDKPKMEGLPKGGDKDKSKLNLEKFKGDKDRDFSSRKLESKHWDKWQKHDENHNWVHGHWQGNWDKNHHHDHDWDDDWRFRRNYFWGVSGWWYGPWVYNWGYYPYYNPYCSHAIIIGGSPYDYAQPFATVEYPESQEALAARDFDAARNAFFHLDYQTALTAVDNALAKTPRDPAMHEFRALVLFARAEYEPAAATVHSILSVGPGWDWATLRQFYPNVEVYTRQLRALEDFRRNNPKVVHARFLLAYHYLTCNYNDAAAKELKEVVALEPRDRVSTQLLSSLTQPPEELQIQPAPNAAPPVPAVPPAAQTPIDAKAIVGKWNAKQPDGSAVELSLGPDSKFTWKYTREGKPNEYSGTYSVANNLLILQQTPQDAMVGRVEMTPEKGFRFVLMGGPPDDPGLTFKP